MSHYYVTPNMLVERGAACDGAIQSLMRTYGISDRNSRIYLTKANIQAMIDNGDARRLGWLAWRMAEPHHGQHYPLLTLAEVLARDKLHDQISKDAYANHPNANRLYALLTKMAKRHHDYAAKLGYPVPAEV